MTPVQKYENDALDISSLTDIDIALDDYIAVADESDSNKEKKLSIGRMLSLFGFCQGRLTLESGVPISTTAQTAKGTLYFTPYKGNFITLWDGTRWVLFTFSEISLSLSGYTSARPYDIWAYINSGSVALESTIWTSDTARGSSLSVVDGIYCKGGDATRRYLGTIRTSAASQCEDSIANRFVWNYYNRVERIGLTTNTTSSWSYATSAWREANAGTGALRFSFVIGVPEVVLKLRLSCVISSGGSGAGYNAVSYNATTGNNGPTGYASTIYAYYGTYGQHCWYPVAGVGTVYCVETCNVATMTSYGGGSTTGVGDIGCKASIEG